MNLSIALPLKILTTTAGILTLLFSSSCAIFDPNSSPVITTCTIPSDQTGTIEGHWLAHPIPVAFQANAFSAADILGMTQAMDTWNQFFSASKTFPIFDYGTSAANPRTTSVANPAQGSLCSQTDISGGSFTGAVGIYKALPWPTSSNYSSSFIALTTFCTVAGQTYPAMSMAVMELNYTNFFVAGAKQPDIQSVITHEMGHLLGLAHSCGTNANMPNCNSGTLSPDYLIAIMYPVFSFDPTSGIGQQKRFLGTNDMSRANCLY